MRRRRHASFAAFVGLLVLSFAGVAAGLQLQTGSTVLQFDARISPKALPKVETRPAAVRVSGRVLTTDGSLPAALTRIQVKTDRDLALETTGLPACRLVRIQSQDSRGAARICRKSLLGRGTASFTVAFPGAAPILLQGRVLVFNGGGKRGTSTLLVHQFSNAPIPAVAVTPVRIKHFGRNGLSATATVPRIAGGSGFLTSFSVKIRKRYSFRGERRSVISASCGHRRIRFRVRAFFANGASSSGSLTQGCKAR